MITVLGGALLYRDGDGYYWADGTPEPRVTPMCLRDLAGNWRCITYGDGTFVELPITWRRRVSDLQARRVIEGLIDGCRLTSIYAEGRAERTDNHRARMDGYLIPVDAWDDALAIVCGGWWDKEHEADILHRASSAGPIP